MEKEDVYKIILDIEDNSTNIDYECFYSAFKYDRDKFISILNKGVLSKKLYGCNTNNNFGFCGPHFISLFKLEKEYYDSYEYASHRYKYYPQFMIDKRVKAYKTKYVDNGRDSRIMLRNTIIPLRCSNYYDEWQVKSKIDKEYIIGIMFRIKEIVERENMEEVKTSLLELYDIIKILNEMNKDLPIYDYSSLKIVNKSKVLKLLPMI